MYVYDILKNNILEEVNTKMQNSSDIKFANELFQNYEQIMFKIAYNILKNNFEAEDAVQDAFFG